MQHLTRCRRRRVVAHVGRLHAAATAEAVHCEEAELLQRVSVPVYPIGMKNASFDILTDQERKELSVDTLQMLAGSSGGKLHLVAGDGDLRPLAAQISGEVREQYLLGFAPSGKGDVKYRIVFVSVAKPGSWVVRTRRGYRGTAPGGE